MTGIFQRFRGRPKADENDQPTLQARPEKTVPVRPPANDEVGPSQYLVACAQSIGRQRDHNEDALFTLAVNLSADRDNVPFGIFIVADGMGGHLYGEVASEIAVRSMGSYLVSKLYPALISTAPSLPDETIHSILAGGIEEAHQAVLEEAPGGGTTLTALLVVGKRAAIAHVGDSRAYTVAPDGAMKALTRDHSLVNRLVELGQISADEASIHPQRNVLYRALGQAEPVEPDIFSLQLPDQGHVLLCSDGLWGVVPEDDIAELIHSASNLQQACQGMVHAANTNGGPDNITAILIRLPD